MVRVIDVCLDGRCSRNDIKEFNICLGDRITRCDIIVDSIIYKEYLSLSDTIILESCLEDYILQKVFAVSADTELASHIDKMMSICYEKLRSNVEMSSLLAECAICAIDIVPGRVEVSSEIRNLYLVMCAEVDSTIEFTAKCQSPSLLSAILPAQHEIVYDSNLLSGSSVKRESVSSSTVIVDSIAETIIALVRMNSDDTYFTSQAEFCLGRYRALQEMDDDVCSIYDDTTLENIDFIVS